MRNETIIYMDETTFNNQLHKTMTWQQEGDPIKIVRPRPYVGQCTLFGAISPVLPDGGVFQIAKVTNTDTYLEFLKVVKAALPKGCKPYLLFDGHKAHTATDSMLYVEKHFKPLLGVRYSCEFNSIETLWSNFKLRFHKAMARRNFQLFKREELVDLVEDIYRTCPRALMVSICRANLDFIRKYLE